MNKKKLKQEKNNEIISLKFSFHVLIYYAKMRTHF